MEAVQEVAIITMGAQSVRWRWRPWENAYDILDEQG